MLFGERAHADVFQTKPERPVKKRVAGRELVGLLFISGGIFGLPVERGGSGEKIVSERQTGFAADRVAPGGDGFGAASELPERFALFLARRDQIGAFRQRRVERRERLLVASQTIEDRAAIIPAQSFALPRETVYLPTARLLGFSRLSDQMRQQLDAAYAAADWDSSRIDRITAQMAPIERELSSRCALGADVCVPSSGGSVQRVA